MAASSGRKVLLAGNDQFLQSWYGNVLADGGYLADGVALSGLENHLAHALPDLVLIDLPCKDHPIKYLNQILLIRPALPVVLSVEMEDFGCAGEALRFGAADLLIKPVEPQLLLMILHRTLEKDRLLKENRALRSHIDLYTACQRITTQLEAGGVRTATLAALISETGARRAFFLDHSDPEVQEVTEVLGITLEEAKGFSKELIASIQRHGGGNEGYTLSCGEFKLEFKNPKIVEHTEALIVPVRESGSVRGGFMLFRDPNDPPWTAPMMDNVRFIASHTALAWENVTLYAKAKEMAYLDALTGLYNARYLRLAVEREIANSRETGAPLAVLFLDLDFFKGVNDRYGHQVGSQLLVEVGRVIRRCVRDQDTVVRYGGDEFTIILKGTPLSTAEQIAERMRAVLAEHPFLGREGLEVIITASIGVSSYPLHAQDAEGLVYLADQAMYRGKKSTRNQVNTADPNDLTGLRLSPPDF